MYTRSDSIPESPDWPVSQGRHGNDGMNGAKGSKGDRGLQGQKGDQVTHNWLFKIYISHISEVKKIWRIVNSSVISFLFLWLSIEQLDFILFFSCW